MSLHLVVKNSLPASISTYRLLDDRDREIVWANQFLDAQQVRQLSLRSLRAYAYDLLHLARWFKSTRHSLGRLKQSLLLEYVRHQLEQQPSPTSQTINHRLCVLRCLYRFHYAREIPGKPLFQRRYTTRSSLGACPNIQSYLSP
jgi:site-specific recombinase XerD